MALFLDLRLGALGALMVVMGVSYSHPRWRLKARALSGLALVACGQGLLPFFMGGLTGGPGVRISARWIGCCWR